MAYIPEPTLFCLPPDGAPPIQTVAIFSHWAALVLAAAAAGTTLARSKLKGVASHATLGAGLGLTAGAVFAGENLYNNFIYQESAHPATSTGLFLLAGATGLIAAGVTMVPGFKPKRFGWLKFALPALPAMGFALAGIGNLPSVGANAGIALGATGGLLTASAGALLLVDKSGTGNNPQERLGASSSIAFLALGVLTAVGAALTRTNAGVDKGTLALVIGVASFSLFMLMGVLAVAGKPSDFPKPVKPKKVEPAPVPTTAVPPPPPGGLPPPPPPGAPQAPQAPQPPRPQPPRPPVAPPPRKPGA